MRTLVAPAFDMGCCFSNSDVIIEEDHMKNGIANMCRSGMKGDGVKVSTDAYKNIISVHGHGTLLGSCSLECDTAYWEVTVGKNPEKVQIGVKRFIVHGEDDKVSLLLQNTLDAEEKDTFYLKGISLKEGDVVGIFWDQTDLPMLTFSVNGLRLGSEFEYNRIRPTNDIYPAVSVTSGGNCCVVFDGNHFAYPPEKKFHAIVCAANII